MVSKLRAVVDIETIACCPPAILETLIRDAQAEVKKEQPKSNNPKPETIQRIEREYEAKLLAARYKVIDKLPLSPMTGRIVSLALGLRSENPTGSLDDWTFHCLLAKTPDEERDIFCNVEELLDGRDPLWITYNGRRFDMPYLVARSMKWRAGSRLWPVGYQRHSHVDLYDALGSGSMNDWAMALLGDMTHGSGGDVAKWAEEEN